MHAVLKDAAEVTRALVGLDRRYSNIPGWQSLKDPGRLGRAAEVCAVFAGYDEPDYAVDLPGWRPAPTTIDGPALPGITGVLQAEHNLLVHLAKFPARSLRVFLDSQRIVSRAAAGLVEPTDAGRAFKWRSCGSMYQDLIQQTRDLGGELGNGGPAAGQGALVASRVQRLTATDLADPTPARQLDRLFARVDHRISEIVEHGAKERLYFLRVPFPRIDDRAAGLVKPTRERYIPITSPVQTDLIVVARTQLRPEPILPRPPEGAGQSRADFEAAIVHRPEGLNTGPSISL